VRDGKVRSEHSDAIETVEGKKSKVYEEVSRTREQFDESSLMQAVTGDSHNFPLICAPY